MPPAARLTDMHVCPMVTGIVPHVGGPIVAPGEPTVLIEFLPAARMTDMLVCVGPPDMIMMGSPTVLIGFLMAARMGDPTVHGGVIVLGAPTVMIGEVGMGMPATVVVTPAAGGSGGAGGAGGDAAAGPAETGGSGITAGAGRQDSWDPGQYILAGGSYAMGGALAQAADNGTPFCEVCSQQGPPAIVVSPDKTSWVEIELVDTDGNPVPGEEYQIVVPGGTTVDGTLDAQGQARVEGIDPGTCQITFPNLDKKSWHPK